MIGIVVFDKQKELTRIIFRSNNIAVDLISHIEKAMNLTPIRLRDFVDFDILLNIDDCVFLSAASVEDISSLREFQKTFSSLYRPGVKSDIFIKVVSSSCSLSNKAFTI